MTSCWANGLYWDKFPCTWLIVIVTPLSAAFILSCTTFLPFRCRGLHNIYAFIWVTFTFWWSLTAFPFPKFVLIELGTAGRHANITSTQIIISGQLLCLLLNAASHLGKERKCVQLSKCEVCMSIVALCRQVWESLEKGEKLPSLTDKLNC
jgi:hypothetical protein